MSAFRRTAFALFLTAFVCVLLMGCTRVTPFSHLDDELSEMEACQRAADNLAFYRSRQNVQKIIYRLKRTERFMPAAEKERLAHAETRSQLISATYFYMMGQQRRAERAMQAINEDNPHAADTRQWLQFRYLCGLYGYGPEAGRLGVRQCRAIAHQLADEDLYWSVEATLIDAALLNDDGRYVEALDTLADVESCATERGWLESLCRVYEQMSVSYAGLDDKVYSDEYRNHYLDLLEEIREDKELTLRKSEEEARMNKVRHAFLLVMGIVLAIAAAFFILARRWRKRNKVYLSYLDEQLEDDRLREREQYAIHSLQTERNKRDNVMRKASMSIVTGVIPLIDRMRREINRGTNYGYVSELAEEIARQNEVLAGWIKTRQGMVSLHIESFGLQPLFDVMAKNNPSFSDRGLTLDVQPTEAYVKADKALTLFMLNTLLDNARKFTHEGGTVRVSAEDGDSYVEISVRDTGVGLSEQEVADILNEKVYDASRIGDNASPEVQAQKGSGFGLMNCKGIIDKYRKTDELFAVCRFGIDSRRGEGSRFWFRLPKAIRRVVALLAILLVPFMATAKDLSTDSVAVVAPYDSLLSVAADYADSVYLANVEHRHEDAFVYADSAYTYINRHMTEHAAESLPLLTVSGSGKVLEREWWMSNFETDYYTLLDLRNELAVASLALHRWTEYRLNNLAYTDLYKLISEDDSLVDYCRNMRRASTTLKWLILACVLAVFSFLLGYWLMALRPRKRLRDKEEQHKMEQAREIEEGSELHRLEHEENRLYVQNQVLDNCLSSIKHETIYYPGRINHLVQNGRYEELPELVDYYSEIYKTLASCAARQLEEPTFRRASVPVDELFEEAKSYVKHRNAQTGLSLSLQTANDACIADGDHVLLRFLLETLVDNAFAQEGGSDAVLTLNATRDSAFVLFSFTDPRPSLSKEQLQDYFSPSTEHMHILMRQIIREHDEYFDHPGCRILARQMSPEGGVIISFTVLSVSHKM